MQHLSINKIPDREHIFVETINNLNGIYLYNKLQQIFPLKDYKKAKYILKTDITTNKSFSNTDNKGLATNIITISYIHYKLINATNNKVLIDKTLKYQNNYGYSNAFQAKESERYTSYNIMGEASKNIARQIGIKLVNENNNQQGSK